MTKNFWLLLFALLLPLSACGPIYTTEYSFVPPKSAEGRMCVQSCGQGQAYCRHLCQMDKHACVQDARDRAMDDYRAYVRRQNAEKKPIKRNPSDFDRSYACGTSSCESRCESDRRECYRDCGGQVIAREVCTMGCDQIPPQPAALPYSPKPARVAAPHAPLCQTGEEVEVLYEDDWYEAVVTGPLRPDGRCPIHYEGYDEDEDEAVWPKRLRPRQD